MIKRRLFNLAAVVSLMVCLATAILWARSYWQGDYLEFTFSADPAATEWREWSFAHRDGAMSILTQRIRSPGQGITYADCQKWQYFTLTGRRYPRVPEFLHGWRDYGWYAPVGSFGGEERMRGAFLPWWLVVTFFAALPAVRTAQSVRRRRAARLTRKNLCPTCGYDLRATPGRCPECGTEPDVKSKTAAMT